MGKIKQKIHWYFYFIKESQKFMKGYNPIIIFVKSLYKGVGFSRNMTKL